VKSLYLLFALLLALVLFFGTAGCEDPGETENRTQAEEPAPETPERADPDPETMPAPEIPDPVNNN